MSADAGSPPDAGPSATPSGPAGPAAPVPERWHYRRSLASRVVLLTVLAVGLSVALVAGGAYASTRLQMQRSLDDSLVDRAQAAARTDALLQLGGRQQVPSYALGASDVRIAFLDASGHGRTLDSGPVIKLGQPELDVARGDSQQSLRTILINGARYRVVAVPTNLDDVALIIAQPLAVQDTILSRLGWVSLFFGIFGVVAAGVAGWAVARNGLRPVRRLTTAVEGIARTEDLRPLPVEGDDELARLATAFNQMLAALDASRVRQRQLVADAGHELRTPLTSLRTNVDLLTMSDQSDGAGIAPEARRELLADIGAQMDELTTLIGDLTELARDEPLQGMRQGLVQQVDVAEVLAAALARVRRRAPGVTFAVRSRPWWLEGEPAALERAVTNLLDNAAKWSPPGGTVTIDLDVSEPLDAREVVGTVAALTVDDEGPGIAETDRDRVFDRFWRANESRTMPGSGLGLSIVRQVAERHSGTVTASASPAGGARLVLRLPGHPTVPDHVADEEATASDAPPPDRAGRAGRSGWSGRSKETTP